MSAPERFSRKGGAHSGAGVDAPEGPRLRVAGDHPPPLGGAGARPLDVPRASVTESEGRNDPHTKPMAVPSKRDLRCRRADSRMGVPRVWRNDHWASKRHGR